MRSHLGLVLVVMLAGGVVGCGGDDDDTPAATGGEGESATAEPAAPAAPVRPTACAGEAHTCVTRPDGHVFCFGRNLDGELGDGTAQNRRTPVPVVGIEDAVEVACGRHHTCARRRSGQVSCWGANDSGQLGNGGTTATLTPVAAQGVTDAVELGAGYAYSCARRSGGTVSCWGANNSGQLGNGTSTASPTPVAVNGLSGATALSLGNATACALVAGGAVHCWGANGFGNLGRGPDFSGSGTAAAPVVGLTGMTFVAVGTMHTCAATPTAVHCWGYDSNGQLGNGAVEGEPDRSPLPVAVTGIHGPISALAAGQSRTCTVLIDGHIQCWGDGAGEGDGGPAATDVPGIDGVERLTLGYATSCAVRRDNQLMCWGRGADGQLGNGEQYARTPAVSLADLTAVNGAASRPAEFPATPGAEITVAPHIAVGRSHACAVLADGRVRCFGSSNDGQTGAGHTTYVPLNAGTFVPGISDAVQVDVTSETSCVVRANGQAACWGTLPVERTSDALQPSSLPIAIPGITDAVEVAVGTRSVCFRRREGGVSCMGQNGYGELGNGTTTRSDVPVAVSGIEDAEQIAVGGYVGCARRTGGTLSCWGAYDYGLLANGETRGSSTIPIDIPLREVTDVALFHYNVCAVHGGGKVSCWGKNDYGQLGMGAMNDEVASAPREIAGIRGAVGVDVDDSTVCAVLGSGEATCWGANTFGQTGHNDVGEGAAVERVLRPWSVERGTDPAVAAFGGYAELNVGGSYTCGVHRDGHVSCSGSTPLGEPGGFFGIASRRSRFPIAAAGLALPVTAAL